MSTILVIEDELPIAKGLISNLEFEGYEVLSAADGSSGLELALSGRADLIVLDIRLPGMDGYQICRRIREQGLGTPIIMLTARGEELDRVLGLELGADDYVTKPFSVRELLARIKAVLRRAAPVEETRDAGVLAFGGATVDFERFEASMEGREVHLSAKEFAILQLLWGRGGKAVSRDDILNEVWGYDVFPTTRTVDNHIMDLRSKLERDPSNPHHIVTVHGVGYRLVTEETG